MEFNEYWTKKDNDLMCQMIKEGKSKDDIIKFFGEEKVKYHPTKKFSQKSVLPYKLFLNEVKINPERTYFESSRQVSNIDPNIDDYLLTFKVNNHEYIIILNYIIDNDIKSYNIFFTTDESYKKYMNELEKIRLEKGDEYILTNDEQKTIRNIAEKETNYHELIPLMKKLSYVLFSFSFNIIYKNPNMLFSLSETERDVKIKLYRNIIKDSFKNVIETESIDEYGNKIYYYKI
jgi:hypothetical protein